MKRIYSDKFIFLYAITFFLSSPLFAQSLSTKPELQSGPNVTEQEIKLMQEVGNIGGSDSNSDSAKKQDSAQYTPPVGTVKLDNIAQKESQTIGKKSDGASKRFSNTVPGADEFTNTVDGNSRKAGENKTPGIWQPLFSLMAVLAVIVIAAWLIKKIFPGQVNSGVGDVVQVIGRVHIDNKNSLCMAKFGNEIVLLGVGINGVNLIDKVSDPDKIASLIGKIESARVSSISKSFANVFKNARGDYLDDNLEDEEIIEEFDDEESAGIQKDDELTGLLNKVKGLSKLKHNNRDH